MTFLYKYIRYQLLRYKIKKNNPYLCVEDNSNKRKIYLFFVACGINMGDHAIVEAEEQFIISALGNDVCIREITVSQVESAIDCVKNQITERDIIVLSAGGNTGDEYIELYYPLLKILNIFKNNRIIILPQTVFFHSKKRERLFCRKLKKCSDLKIFVREEKSKEIFLKNGVESVLVPDIVLSRVPKKETNDRTNQILLCLRNDVERGIKDSQAKTLREVAAGFGETVKTDTVLKHPFPISERAVEVEKMLSTFASSKLVITDRLHGMIFSYLTLTPCIVVKNYSHKVESEYNFIKECEFISFVKDIKEEVVLKEINKVINAHRYPIENFEHKFQILKEILRSAYE